MMKKDSSVGSKNVKARIFGATPPQVSEDDASQLVGGIIEKGFSDILSSGSLGQSTDPRPTVLPFPVARHRSHGPHWAPRYFEAINDNDHMDEDVGEEEDSDGMVMAAGAAKPVERKQNKGLDFSRWQEIAKNDGNYVLNDKKEIDTRGLDVGRKAKELHSNNLSRKFTDSGDSKLRRTSDHVNEPFTTVGDDMVSTGREVIVGTEGVSEVHSLKHINNGNIVQQRDGSQYDTGKSEESTVVVSIPAMQKRISKEIHVDLKMQKFQTVSGFSQKSMGGENESLESQIDAENRTRLAQMSAKEIVAAQAEVLAKLDPALINALRKRGESKAKGLRFSSSDITENEADDMQHEKDLSHLIASSGDTISQKPVELAPGDTLQDRDDRDSPNISPENRSMWDAWRERVEHVRGMRFSLDGNIIDSELGQLAHEPDACKASSESGYNVNNVSERDFIRTAGDPGAAGYTIKEAVALSRSVVPGQRTIALHLIAAILDRAIGGICQNQVDYSSKSAVAEGADWEAIWAFVLGPEPELALALRMSLDDNHNSVVLSCAKAIQCALSCDVNEILFGMFETPIYTKDVCTAPVFRSKPEVNIGFLRGGFWKYNTKPSNIRCFGDEESEKAEDGPTIQDDIVVAGQDFAAGLVRMGILPRICYLLETDPAAPLEECLISILIAIARHSPTSAAAIVECERLVQTIVNRFTFNVQMEISLSKIKSVRLLKVLARIEKMNCFTFMNEGVLQKLTWHLYRCPFSLDQWVKSGRGACKLSSALLVEQLRLWKVFTHYGYCLSDISDLFPLLCVWLTVPSFEKLIDNDVMDEYCAVANEVYLLLDVLAGRLPKFYSCMHERTEDAVQDEKSVLWNFLGSIVDQALEWLQVKNIPCVRQLFTCQVKDGGKNLKLHDSEINSLLWVMSSVLNLLSSLLKAVIPEDITSFPSGHLPWLPDFIPNIGLKVIKNGYFTACNNHLPQNDSLFEYLCILMSRNRPELAISSVCCLQGLVQVVASVDELIGLANLDIHNMSSKYASFSREDKILANGIIYSCVDEIEYLLSSLLKLITNEWQQMRLVEIFSRGGPSPGVGVGWGASGGGYWSLNNFLTQQYAKLLVFLLEVSEIPFTEGSSDATRVLNCALTACLFVGPGNNSPVIGKLLEFIFRVPVLQYLDLSIQKFLSSRKGWQSYSWNYTGDYASFANVLAAHFRNRWLGVKRKKTGNSVGVRTPVTHKSMKTKNLSLETIYEDMDVLSNPASRELSSLTVVWAHQRLPLPAHWFLSAISAIHSEKPPDYLEAARGGLFFLLGIETLSGSAVISVSVVWKLHAMSVVLLSGMDILRDEKSRDIYEILQNVYGEIVCEKKFPLQFEKEIHESYATFIDTLVEQFAAESYGDLLFGRQVALYLHRSVEASVRLAAWNALSNARALELLPPVDKCFTIAEGFLEPVEDNERMLEGYVKSWVSGALDKAASRNSVTYLLAVHHISCFIFGDVSSDMVTLRNKLVKSLVRDFSRKHQHEGMMSKLICYTRRPYTTISSTQLLPEIEKRVQLLRGICDGLAKEVEKLESCVKNRTLVSNFP